MPLHNAIGTNPALSRMLARVAGLSDGEDGVGRLGETLTPTINPWERPEWAVLQGELLATGGIALGAPGAGLIAQIQLFNPLASRRLITARFEAGGGALAVFEIRTAAIALPLDSGIWKGCRDSRAQPDSPVGEIWYDNTAAAAVGTRRLQSPNVLASTPYREYRWWILHPGRGLAVNTGALNQALTVNFEWRERLALPGEVATTT